MPAARMKSSKRPSAKILEFRRKPEIKQKSYDQMRQRELSWLLYITEGYAANLAHALAVNCVTFTVRDSADVGRILSQVEGHAQRLRDMLQPKER